MFLDATLGKHSVLIEESIAISENVYTLFLEVMHECCLIVKLRDDSEIFIKLPILKDIQILNLSTFV